MVKRKRHQSQGSKFELFPVADGGRVRPTKNTSVDEAKHALSKDTRQETENGSRKRSRGVLSQFPYPVDFNDHFETPLRAFQDIAPLLDMIAETGNFLPKQSKRSGSACVNDRKIQHKDKTESDGKLEESLDQRQLQLRSHHILYDPYYCNGRSQRLLNSLGFSKVLHEKRDFYRDVEGGTVPSPYHTLVTNPPYSLDHKEKCLEFCLASRKPFFLLLPNYVAVRSYYRDALEQLKQTESPSSSSSSSASSSSASFSQKREPIVYVRPAVPYEYHHLNGRGYDKSPFESLWFCAIGTDRVERACEIFRSLYGKDAVHDAENGMGNGVRSASPQHPLLITTLRGLESLQAVPTLKRKNPRQRRADRKKKEAIWSIHQTKSTMDRGSSNGNTNTVQKNLSQRGGPQALPRTASGTSPASEDLHATGSIKKKKSRKSQYRDEFGVRKKQRF